MNVYHRNLWLLGFMLSFAFTNPAQAGWMCSNFGIGCSDAEVSGGEAEGLKLEVDQDNPPEVFAFTVSATFDEWTDIPAETFVCDTRESEDRSCAWRGYIPEIKRHVQVVFTPFPHDLGMYKVRALIVSNLGRDPDYATQVGLDDAPEIQEAPGVLATIRGGVPISILAQATLKARVFEAGRYKVSLREEPYGEVSLKFKGVLK